MTETTITDGTQGTTAAAEPEVVATIRNHTGVLELNRPKALNSLTRRMVDLIVDALDAWRDNDEVEQVLVCSRSPKAFCAGGDVRAARDGIISGKVDEVDDFFVAEYNMNALIAEYPKPYIAVIDGVVMGGGLGVSAHGSHRIVTDKAFASMPEMAIGFVTDVGVAYMAQRMLGARGALSPALAKYWGITGYRMYAADMLWSGLATHYVTDAQAVIDAIISDGVDKALGEHAVELDDAAPLAAKIDLIEATFDKPEWSEIQAALQGCGDKDFVDEVEGLLSGASPTSVVAAAELFRAEEKRVNVRSALVHEERLGRFMRRRQDFIEGVRAVLVEKTKDATFEPDNYADVDVRAIREVIG